MMSILLIEDEMKTAQSVKIGLEENGYEVDLAFDGTMGLSLALRKQYDLIITDIIIPGINGIELCRIIRESGKAAPMIMLTALGMTSDKITGFNAGTDDYLVKPFDFQELLVRIRSLINRSRNIIQADKLLVVADLVLNLDSKQVYRENKKVDLTAREFSLLEFLIRNKGKVVSKSEISEKVWEINFDTGTNVIEVYMSYLRNKVDKNFSKKLIHTKIGMGYILKDE